MQWQTVVIIIAVMALCCFYRWCSMKNHESDTHRKFADTQLEAQRMQHDQFLIQHGRGTEIGGSDAGNN